MDYQLITTRDHLERFCESATDASFICFDTEFVSEDRYLPELCLLQVAIGDQFTVIDPLAIGDIDCFWQMLVEGDHTTIVHAGREEFRFCRRATGQRPKHLYDIQLAAGMIGMEYPAAYRTLVLKLQDVQLAKGETRTDWRRRPLSTAQLNYAVIDVVHLFPIYSILQERLEELERSDWFQDEMEAWQAKVEDYEDGEQWRRVSGATSLSRRALAIVRELWRWRDGEARRRDRPARRILRDDLMVELAKRQTASVKKIRAIRGMNHRETQKALPDLGEAIARAMELPDDECPVLNRRQSRPQMNALTQFMACALSTICRTYKIAPAITGTSDDMRDLLNYLLHPKTTKKTPSLAKGWRAQVVGSNIQDILDGRLALVVDKATDDNPITFREL